MGEANQVLDLINERLEKINLKLIVNNESEVPNIDDEHLIQGEPIGVNKTDHLINIEGKECNILKVTNIPELNDEIVDIDGNKYRIEKEIVKSTDGIIYRMNKNSSCKIFNENCLNIELYKKLKNIMNEQAELVGVKWPIEFLFNKSDKPEIVGYRMDELYINGKRTLDSVIKLNDENKYNKEQLYSICFKMLTIINELQKYHLMFNHIDLNDILISEEYQIELINIDHYMYDREQDTPLFNLPDQDHPKKLMIYKEQFLQVYQLFNRVLDPIHPVQCDVCGNKVDEKEITIEGGIKQCKTCYPSTKCELCEKWVKKDDITILGEMRRCSKCIDKVQCPLCEEWVIAHNLEHKEKRGQSVTACKACCEIKEPCDDCCEWIDYKLLKYDDNRKIKCPNCIDNTYCIVCDQPFSLRDIKRDNGVNKCHECIDKEKCEDCNNYHNKQTLKTDSEGKEKCESCYNKKICEVCDEPFIRNGSFLNGGSNRCQSCLKKDPCHVCGEYFDIEALTYADDGKIKCTKCHRKLKCGDCGGLFDKDDLKFDFNDFKQKCSLCLKEPCNVCNDRFHTFELTIDDGMYKCEGCLDKVPCDACKKLYDLDHLNDHDGKVKCKECLNKIFLACDVCNREFEINNLTFIDNLKQCEDCKNKVPCDQCNRLFSTEELTANNDLKRCSDCMEKIECDLCKNVFNLDNLVDGDDGMVMCKACAKKVPCKRCKERYDKEFISEDTDGMLKCNTCLGLRNCIHCGKEYRATGILKGSKLCEICIDLLVKIPCNRCRKHIYVHKKHRYSSFLKDSRLCKKHFDAEYNLIKCRKCKSDFVKVKNGEAITLCDHCNKLRNKIIIATQDFFESIKTGQRKK
ncbi:hypothetical protein [Haloplasma contractile]|uniref:Protein kinase domain-containing protein n=1 Tax=Haloplasma contractile SSD-17B TaxID=1033810 RepID=U2DSL9_9MOLU|nr:hypothetical protein [Haloplasma contractile]ERJ11502.1 hypothetical protein HLPCO_002414 [Haloplasma contractile SSD-17B]